MHLPSTRREVLSAAIKACILILIAALVFEIADVPSRESWGDLVRLPNIWRHTHDTDIEAIRKVDHRLLTSKRFKDGTYHSIDLNRTGIDVLNPTLLELPRGSQHDFLVVARAFHVDEHIDGVDYRRARQVAMFANLTDNDGKPELETGEWKRLLVEDFLGPKHHCKAQPKMDKYIGPEDMKAFWSRTRAPLIIFTHQTPDENLCEGMFIIDARAAVPEFGEILGSSGLDMPPVYFQEPTPLYRRPPEGQEEDARYQREKNWALTQSPLLPDDQDLFVMAEPGQLFRFKSIGEPVEQVPSEEKSLVEAPFPYDANETWHSKAETCVHDVMRSDSHVHQSTPMLSLTLCNRGSCTPKEDNTVLIGMVQRRYDPPVRAHTMYERRIVAYNSAPPYQMRSVSKKLMYPGEEEDKYIWTGGMVFFANSTDIPLDRSHGFLDDEVWLSFGIMDKAPGWLDVSAEELIKYHYFCEGASRGYRDSVEVMSL
ncbi:hypothetical protein GMORB2_4359 [Geosmithia morbida]|uniref:Uncharacterized protein n=1 Tax=Geosmithia morbida TaxID=1094350 RepID=A0A9P4Z2N3_9HYPO|nr:uncharacterized protein GMORB2_4359 [Geosmithia morbida]KAF4125519.1 hypothetical protein GMORB2_4359 [Geosmithia morbida]